MKRAALATMRNVDAPQEIDGIAFPPNLEPVRLLGHGSMASVYLARDRQLKRLVAVKFLKSELCDIEQSRQRFEREAQAAARLSHERITTVYSVGRTVDGRPYIEMEYVDGINLEELIRSRGALPVPEACALLAEVASALAAAHERSIVHRDVKPANVLIDNASGAATLTDFGVAAILQTGDAELARLTREGELLGDPRYMSPEQLRGEPLTGQSDVYSLGIVAYEIVCGSGPFDDATVTDMASAHIRRAPPSLSARNASVPEWLSELVQRCLAKKPEHRPRARDLAKRLAESEGVERGMPGSATAAAVPGFFLQLKQRRVYQAAAAYAAGTFVLLQAVDLVLQPWPQFDVAYRFAVIACVAGFPITIIMAWLYDLRRGRLVVADQDGDATPALESRRRHLLLLGAAASLVFAVVVTWWLFG